MRKLAWNILQEVLEDIDESLCTSGVREKEWEIARKDPASILTSFGTLKYNKTYFKPQNGGKRKYLVDKIVGIEPHDRVSSDVVINASEEAIESSYLKGGKNAGYIDEITKQTVMNIIHAIDVEQPKIEVKEKKEAKILYVEADEDHVALPQLCCGGNIIIVILYTPLSIIMY